MKKWLLIVILVPQLAFGSIAFDYQSENTWNTASSQTWSHTITGSDTILIVYGWVNSGSDSVSSVTFNGDALTRAGDVTTYNGGGNRGYLYYLVNPDSGTHNIVATLASSLNSVWTAVSYTGAKQTGQPDSYYENAGDGSSNSFSMTTTTVADNSWLVGFSTGLDGACSAGTGTTIRDNSNPIASDSGGAITPAGSASLSFTSCGNRVEDKMMVSIAPSVPATPQATTSPFATTTIYYHDWLLVNAVIIGLLAFVPIGFLLSPLKK